MKDLGLLLVRLIVGGLIMGHGAQKLFGVFGGGGVRGTAGWLESMGMRPPSLWAYAAGLSEFGGGLLSTLGLFNPLGPLGVLAAMSVAIVKGHWGKPIWATSGGAELPLINMAIAVAMMIEGPGRYSLDRVLGTRLTRKLSTLATIATVAGIVASLVTRPAPAVESELQASEEPDSFPDDAPAAMQTNA